MKSISSRLVFTLSFTAQNSKTIKNSHNFSCFSTTSNPQTPACNYYPRRSEEDTRSVPVSVWWDFENCNLPFGTNVFSVAQCVTKAVRANGIKGPVHITAFGDVMQISRTNQEALSSTGINLTHVPSGGKNSADRSLLVDLMYWVSQNPPPAHLFLISGDRDFACILHRLRMNNYNILLASPDSAPSVLCGAATIMWQWSSLLKGENLSGKLFNQPPDGPYGSWYSHFRGVLENPFPVNKQSSCLPVEESAELASDCTPRPIPNAVVKQICQILQSNPEGISITQLRAELKKSDLTIDKDLYGYNKFSRFLSAMPRVLKLHPEKDGQFLVAAVKSKLPDEPVPATNSNGYVSEKLKTIPVPEDKTKSQALNFLESQNKEEKSKSSPVMEVRKLKAPVKNLKGAQKDEKWNEAKLDEIKVNHATDLKDQRKEEKREESPAQTNMQDANLLDQQNKVGENSPIEVKEISETNDNCEDANNKNVAPVKIGFFRRILIWWFGPGDTNSDKKLVGGGDYEEKDVITSKDLISNFSHESLNSEFNSESEVEKNTEKVDQIKDNTKQLELFLKEAFWNELGLFIVTSQGSDLIFQSTTRGHLGQNLKKKGPLSLQYLSEDDLLQLVDMLISDKKWVEETYSQIPPFKLTLPTEKGLSNDTASSLKGLSNIFSIKKPNLRELSEKKHQNPPHTGVPHQPTSLEECSSRKPRREMLNDCQKLVDNITKNHPQGFAVVRKLFLEKHGYPLNLQKLGYEKLVNLLQILPGMKIESNLILPGGPSKSRAIQLIDSDGEFVNNSSKDSDSDCSWDELGPVDASGSKKEETVVGVNKTPLKLKTEKKEPEYELLDEEEFSGSDEEELCVKSEKESGMKEDSSLHQILDSWYVSKEEAKRKDEIVGVSKMDGSDTGMVSSSVIGVKTRNESSVVRKLKRAKSFSFVVEEKKGDSKDKMIGRILDSLKKTGERSGES